jgi:hypothetical protein
VVRPLSVEQATVPPGLASLPPISTCACPGSGLVTAAGLGAADPGATAVEGAEVAVCVVEHPTRAANSIAAPTTAVSLVVIDDSFG